MPYMWHEQMARARDSNLEACDAIVQGFQGAVVAIDLAILEERPRSRTEAATPPMELI